MARPLGTGKDDTDLLDQVEQKMINDSTMSYSRACILVAEENTPVYAIATTRRLQRKWKQRCDIAAQRDRVALREQMTGISHGMKDIGHALQRINQMPLNEELARISEIYVQAQKQLSPAVEELSEVFDSINNAYSVPTNGMTKLATAFSDINQMIPLIFKDQRLAQFVEASKIAASGDQWN